MGDGAEGIHIGEMVAAFRRLGHGVKVVGPMGELGPSIQETGNPGRDNSKTGDPKTIDQGTPNAKGQVDTWQRRMGRLKKYVRGPGYEFLELGYNLAAARTIYREVKSFRPHFIYDRYITYNYAVVGMGKLLGIPVFLEVNAPLSFERSTETDEKLYFRRLASSLEVRTCRHAFKTIVVSTPLKAYLMEKGVPGEGIQVFANGVNREKFFPVAARPELQKAYGIGPENVVIGFTGILRPWHGIDLLVSAFSDLHAQYPDTLLLLVGDGDIRREIEDLARKNGCQDAVKITGRIPHTQVNDHIGLFDLAVSPRTTFYASPMKIPEYMALGKPVVAPDTPNIHDLLENDRTGVLFTPESRTDLLRALTSLVADSDKRVAMGQAGQREVNARLNWESIAGQVVSIYEDVHGPGIPHGKSMENSS